MRSALLLGTGLPCSYAFCVETVETVQCALRTFFCVFQRILCAQSGYEILNVLAALRVPSQETLSKITTFFVKNVTTLLNFRAVLLLFVFCPSLLSLMPERRGCCHLAKDPLG
jgi:hypothetical protein